MDGTNLEHLPAGVEMNIRKLPENLRWPLQHMADFLPTAGISRGTGEVVQLPEAHRDLDTPMLAPRSPTRCP